MNVMTNYRTCSQLSSDDSDDSDKECSVWKRAIKNVDESHVEQKTKLENVEASVENKMKRKRNTVWSDLLEDQLISDDLGEVMLKNKPAHYGSRGHESYDYTLKYSVFNVDKDSDCAMSEGDASGTETKLEKSFHHNSFKSQKFVRLNSVERAVVARINKVLNEKKLYLIYRVVKYIGIEKAISLLNMTEEIEENGGMLTNNQARRRTPGGVYIQLLKNDKDISKEALDKIFEGEVPSKELKKYYRQAKNKKNFKKKKHSNGGIIGEKIIIQMEKMDDRDTFVVDKHSNENLKLDNNLTPVPVLHSNNIDSELEDGEIED